MIFQASPTHRQIRGTCQPWHTLGVPRCDTSEVYLLLTITRMACCCMDCATGLSCRLIVHQHKFIWFCYLFSISSHLSTIFYQHYISQYRQNATDRTKSCLVSRFNSYVPGLPRPVTCLQRIWSTSHYKLDAVLISQNPTNSHCTVVSEHAGHLPVHRVAGCQEATTADGPRHYVFIPLSSNDECVSFMMQIRHSRHGTSCSSTTHAPANKAYNCFTSFKLLLCCWQCTIIISIIIIINERLYRRFTKTLYSHKSCTNTLSCQEMADSMLVAQLSVKQQRLD